MPPTVKKLLGNHAVNLQQQVANERLKRSGVRFGRDLRLGKRAAGQVKFPASVIKRMAGD